MIGDLRRVACFIVFWFVEMRSVDVWLGTDGELAVGGRTVLASVDWRFHVGHVRRDRRHRDIVDGLHRVHSHVPLRSWRSVVVVVNVRTTSRPHPLSHAIGRVSLGPREGRQRRTLGTSTIRLWREVSPRG